MTATVARDDVAVAARNAGLEGQVVCVHSSLRSFGTVTGGPDAIVDGLLDTGATVVVPTSSFRFCKAPRPDGVRHRPFNSEDDGSLPPAGSPPTARFHPGANFVDPAMGAIPASVLERPGRVRGNHPLNSFTAVGPLAEPVIAGQDPMRVYAPLEEMVDRGGSVVCMGVGLDALTLIHLAEARAGLRLLHRWGWCCDGSVVEAVHGGCSRGFERLADAVRPAERTLTVGDSTWRIFDAADLLRRAADRFVADPSAGACGDPTCARCRDQVAYGLSRRVRGPGR